MNRKKEKQERKLTKEEQKRREAFEQECAKRAEEGYEKTDLTVGIVFANVMAVLFVIPFAILFGMLFLHRNESLSGEFSIVETTGFLLVFFIMIVAHELIHGITWAFFAENHFKSIHFGFIVAYLTPYCCCVEPLKRYQYVIGALMPTILLGLIPCIWAVCYGSQFWLLLGLCMIMGGGGDATIVGKLLLHHSKKKDVLYLDHPYECGMVLFER